MIEKLTDSIIDYIDVLKNDYGFEITIHDMVGNIKASVYRLLPYNIHRNPYCVFLKTNNLVWQHCLDRQYDLYKHIKEPGMLTGECFCGVREHVFSLTTLNNTTIGFLCVTGYRAEKEESMPRLEACIKKYEFDRENLLSAYRNSLSTEMPSADYVQILINPLLCMVTLLDYYVSLLRTEKDHITGININEKFGLIIGYIDSNFHSKLTVRKVADMFDYSESYINHLFKKKCGCSFSQYVTGLRTEAAKCLLKTPNLKIWEIALSVGYHEPNYFCMVFKKETGLTPTEYRESCIEN